MNDLHFRSTVTLYTPLFDGTYDRRVIERVKVIHREAASPELTAYLPLYGRRNMTYLPPDEWGAMARPIFTVKLGQLIVPYETKKETPPADALTVTEVIRRTSGSRRLHHIQLKATLPPVIEEEESSESTENTTEEQEESQ